MNNARVAYYFIIMSQNKVKKKYKNKIKKNRSPLQIKENI